MTRILAATLAVLMPLQAFAQAAPAAPEAAETVVVGSTITVTAARFQETAVLKTARGAGGVAAVGGAGWIAYIAFVGPTGPFGWAAALLFLGGMTAYLSHRRLQGREDFPPKGTEKQPPAPEKTAEPPAVSRVPGT